MKMKLCDCGEEIPAAWKHCQRCADKVELEYLRRDNALLHDTLNHLNEKIRELNKELARLCAKAARC